MRITRSPTRLTSLLTVDADLDFLTLYQTKRLASPASGEALRKGNRDITKSEIATNAGILLSQLVNTYLLPTIMTTRGDMVYRGASYPGRIPAGTTGHGLFMGANDPGWIAAYTKAQVDTAITNAFAAYPPLMTDTWKIYMMLYGA